MGLLRLVVVLTISFGMVVALGVVPDAVLAAEVVGDGGTYACTRDGLEDAIDAAVTADPESPGRVTFDCSDNLIEFSSDILIGGLSTEAVVIDGSNGDGDSIILEGNFTTNFFTVDTSGYLTLQNMTLQHGSFTEGGAIDGDSNGHISIISTTFLDNQAATGGAIDNDDLGTLTISRSSFFNNGAGGGLTVGLGGAISNDGVLSISRSIFTGNDVGGGSADSFGGAIYNTGALTISQGIFNSNDAGGGSGAGQGGAIFNLGTATIGQSLFISNDVGGGEGESSGGAIVNGGALTVSQSTFTGNEAGGGEGAGFGGAITNTGNAVNVVASTFFDNRASSGSAVFVSPAAITTKLAWSTIVQPPNTSPALAVGNALVLEGIVLGGFGAHCQFSPTGGPLIDSYTLANDTTCGLGGNGSDDTIPQGDGLTNLGLGPLSLATVNGVPQRYYPLLDGSPAIDAGLPSCDTGIMNETDPEPDQIDHQPPFGPACDIGAIEFIEPISLCANEWDGSLRVSDRCSRSETLIELPDDAPVTLCVNDWNGSASLGDDCERDEHSLIVTRNGQIPICINRWNGALRVSDQCSRSERSEWL